MFILPSRGRPHNLRRFLENALETGHTAGLLVYLDEDDPELGEYRKIQFPAWWTIHMGPPVHLGGVYEWVFKTFPDWPYYGFLGDDLIPRTQDWDKKLIEAAGEFNVAYPNDKFWQNGELATHPCLGGKLVREIGWLAYPGLKRTYIDTVWHTIGQARGVLKFLPDVVLEHMHYLNQKAEFDETYLQGLKHNLTDRALYENWVNQPAVTE